MNTLLDGLKGLGAARLAAMAAVSVGLLVLLALLALKSGSNDQMALLYGDLDLRESAQIVEQLARRHIAYRIGGGGAQILVPSDAVGEARMLLARDGLPTGGSVGYELFDRGDSLMFSEFQQKINETRALEGEIARTIRVMRGIRQARVHLVLPRREPFARDRQDAQASVMLTMAGAQRLDREGVQAILNLVAAAVPGLNPRNIAIVDARGGLLARAGEPVGQSAAALSAEELRRATELRLSRAVEEMLERTLGAGRVRAEAAVRMNFDRVNETNEKYDPDGQVTRSTQTVSSSNKSTEPAATVSVQNNLPNADTSTSGGGSQDSRQEETTNYEIGRTVRTLIREQPQIERISLAVMVDGVELRNADGSSGWQPRGQDELDRITSLVRSAIGYDEKRGDHVDVVSMRFVNDAAAAPEPEGLLGIRLEKADGMKLAQSALFGLIGLLALLLVLRPMVNRITGFAVQTNADGTAVALPYGERRLADNGMPGSPSGGMPGGSAGAMEMAGAGGTMPSGGLPGTGSGFSAHDAATLLVDESMVSIAQIEGQMRASSLRKLADLVENHPDETLTIMRGWMAQEHG